MCGKYCTERIRFTIYRFGSFCIGRQLPYMFVCLFLIVVVSLIFEGVAGSY